MVASATDVTYTWIDYYDPFSDWIIPTQDTYRAAMPVSRSCSGLFGKSTLIVKCS